MMADDADRKPIPDPTMLTTEQLMREVGHVLREVGHVKELLETKIEGAANLRMEQLSGISKQFEERDKAVSAALQAQKEATREAAKSFQDLMDKTEKGLTKQIDFISAKVDDLKDRTNLTEGRGVGVATTDTVHRQVNFNTSSIIGTYVIAGIAVLAIIADILSRKP